MLSIDRYIRLRRLLAYLWSASVSRYNPTEVVGEAIQLR